MTWSFARLFGRDVNDHLDGVADRHVKPYQRVYWFMVERPEQRPPQLRPPEAWCRTTGLKTLKAWATFLAALRKTGHLTQSEDGALSCPRAEEEWLYRDGERAKKKKAGQKGGEARQKRQRNQRACLAPARHLLSNTNKQQHKQNHKGKESPSIPHSATGERVEDQGRSEPDSGCGELENALEPLLEFHRDDRRWRNRVLDWVSAHTAAGVSIATIAEAVRRGVAAIAAGKMRGSCHFGYLDGFVRTVHLGLKPQRSERRGALGLGEALGAGAPRSRVPMPTLDRPPAKASASLRSAIRAQPRGRA